MKLVARYFLLAWFYALPIAYIVAVYHSTVTIPNVTVHHWTTGWKELGRVVERQATALKPNPAGRFLSSAWTPIIWLPLSRSIPMTPTKFSHATSLENGARGFDYWTAKIDPVGLNALAVDLE